MSVLIPLTHEVSTHVLTHHPLDGTGVLDWATQKNTQVQVLLRALSVTLGIIFVIWQAVSSHGAMARIIIAIASSALFVWAVFNVTANKDRVQDEVNSIGPAVVQVVPHAQAASTQGVSWSAAPPSSAGR